MARLMQAQEVSGIGRYVPECVSSITQEEIHLAIFEESNLDARMIIARISNLLSNFIGEDKNSYAFGVSPVTETVYFFEFIDALIKIWEDGTETDVKKLQIFLNKFDFSVLSMLLKFSTMERLGNKILTKGIIDAFSLTCTEGSWHRR